MKSLPFFLLLAATATAFAQKSLKPAEFQKQLLAAKDPVLVDVRTTGEFSRGHLEGATLIDIYRQDAKQKLMRLPKNQPIFVYCLTGARSWEAATFLKKQGFSEVYDLSGGIMQWSRAGLPVSKNTAPALQPDWSAEKLKQTIASAQKPVVVNFYAPWCAPCKKMEPAFSLLSKEFGDKVQFHKVDLDRNASLADAEKIGSIPVTRIYAKGKLVVEKSGYLSDDELRRLFEYAAKGAS
jgi:thioredoxin